MWNKDASPVKCKVREIRTYAAYPFYGLCYLDYLLTLAYLWKSTVHTSVCSYYKREFGCKIIASFIFICYMICRFVFTCFRICKSCEI